MTTETCTTSTFSAAPLRSKASALTMLRAIFALYSQRKALAKLDASDLRDLGLTRAQALEEANRPIWDVPSNWRG